jgi:hypothetical protein
MKSWIPWVLVVALAAALLYQCQRGPESLGRAVAEHQVSVAVGSFDEGHGTVLVTVSRQPGVAGKISAVLPVGTIIHNLDSQGQRLITAGGVTLVLQPGEDSTSATVEVYCLDQFASQPTVQTSLALALAGTSDENVTEYEETEPVRKLDACLEKQGFAHKPKQIAVWMVAGGYLDQDYATVRERLFQQQLNITRSQAEEDFSKFAEKTREVLRQHNFPSDRVEQRLAHYRSEVMGEQETKRAGDETKRLLFQFRDSSPTLSPCIDDVSSKKFFSSVPAE